MNLSIVARLPEALTHPKYRADIDGMRAVVVLLACLCLGWIRQAMVLAPECVEYIFVLTFASSNVSDAVILKYKKYSQK
jgi:hypothetical protein